MFYPNFNPFFMQNRNYNMYNNSNVYATNLDEKKDTVSTNNDTISFQDFYDASKTESNHSKETKSKNRLFSFDKKQINLLGFTFEIDDLIIIGLIILLLLESDENYAIIIILGLILLNINLDDIFNFF